MTWCFHGNQFSILLWCIFRFNYFLANFGRVFFYIFENSRNPRWQTKLAALQIWWGNYYVMWHNHLMMWISNETLSEVLSTRPPSLVVIAFILSELRSGHYPPPPPSSLIVEDNWKVRSEQRLYHLTFRFSEPCTKTTDCSSKCHDEPLFGAGSLD